MKIAVVIPALREAGRIARAVASAQCDDAEVVVVDGGSDDGTRERAEAAGARIVASAPGRARQLQVGVEATSAPVLLFLHGDSRLPTGWSAAVARALEDPAVCGGAFAFRFDRRSWRLAWIEWGARLRVRCLGLPYGDQGIFIRRDVLGRLGGVPQVALMEDLDLVAGMRRAGRIALLDLAVTTSARRYAGGSVRPFLRNLVALTAWRLGLDRDRVAAWYRA